MLRFTAQYLVDAEGNRIKVVLDLADYEHLLIPLEGADDLRACDGAKVS